MGDHAARCASCKFWHQPWNDGRGHYLMADEAKAAGEEASEWGVCLIIRHPGTGAYTPQQAERYGWPAPGPEPSARAFTADGSDFDSDLSTRSDFGCVEHTPRGG